MQTMDALRRRWLSIDRKLPILASGLVVLTAVSLGTTAYVLSERALVDAAGRRLSSVATIVAQMVVRPNPRITDSVGRVNDATLRAFANGKGSAEAAYKALSRMVAPRDTARLYAALVDPSGKA